MKSNMAFMHSEPAFFFVPRLPFGFLLSIRKIGYSGGDGDGLMWSCDSLATSGFFFQASMSTSIEI